MLMFLIMLTRPILIWLASGNRHTIFLERMYFPHDYTLPEEMLPLKLDPSGWTLNVGRGN